MIARNEQPKVTYVIRRPDAFAQILRKPQTAYLVTFVMGPFFRGSRTFAEIMRERQIVPEVNSFSTRRDRLPSSHEHLYRLPDDALQAGALQKAHPPRA